MDNKENEFEEPIILKAAEVSVQQLDNKELAKINKLALEPLEEDEIFIFKVAMCDNEIDRQFEVFPLKTLEGLQKMYIGKTVIKDHRKMADNQVARIYDTELVQHGSKITKNGELYTQLVARCYMLNNEANKNLIAEIKAGIKKEVSVGCAVDKTICSICGTDNRKEYCKHWWGRTYENKVCHFKLEDPKDAYELSFVAVPAQAKAGTMKKYGTKYKDDKLEESNLELIVKDIDSFLFINKNMEV